jgi:hypothetical protein
VFPEWQGSALIGSPSRDVLVCVAIDGEAVTDEEIVPLGARVRDVAHWPDGVVHILPDQDDGKIGRLAPLPEGSGVMQRCETDGPRLDRRVLRPRRGTEDAGARVVGSASGRPAGILG